MKKHIFSFAFFVSALILSAAFIGNAYAQGDGVSADALSKLTYPISELGNCKDQADCKIYCDNSVNMAACVSYGEKMNLLSREELKVAKNFLAAGGKGPGDCSGKDQCQTYCDDKANIDACVSYAEKNNLMSDEDLQKAKKIQTAMKKGVKFPSCQNKKECDIYCEDSGHMEECVAFAREAGLLSSEELQNTQKILTAVKQGVKLPACKGKEACDAYCAEASHADECVNFAIEAGIVTSEEARIIKETGGKGPGGCKNKSECDSYCNNEANRDVCMSFAKEHSISQPEPPQQPGQMKPDGTGPGNGADQGQGGPGEGSGPGNGTGQGGGSGPNQGQNFNPGSGQSGGKSQNTNSNPVKCIEDCEYVGKTCLANQNAIGEDCASAGQYCRMVSCDMVDADGGHATAEVTRPCLSSCEVTENACHAMVTENSSKCTTAKDVCVMNCQKASKPAQPAQPAQPSQPNQPSPPSQPVAPNQPAFPSQPSLPTQPVQPGQPMEPTAPVQGYCGDGKCGRMEQADSALCPQDCGGQ